MDIIAGIILVVFIGALVYKVSDKAKEVVDGAGNKIKDAWRRKKLQ